MLVSEKSRDPEKSILAIDGQIKYDFIPVWKYLVKRLIDLTAALAILVVGFPFFIILAVLIKLDSKGPILFRQKRLGKNGKVFYCVKFRTMVDNAEEALRFLLAKDIMLKEQWEVYLKIKDDPRITRLGRFLRKTCLDELPQIINVLKGEMSLVGPRPRADYELKGRTDDPVFKLGLSVLPGITGLWQVSGRNELNYEQRISLDAEYVRNWCLLMDFCLLFRTISVVIKQKGHIEL